MKRPRLSIARRVAVWTAIILCSPLALGLLTDYFETPGMTEFWFLPNPSYALTFERGRVGVTHVPAGTPPMDGTIASATAWGLADRPHRFSWWFVVGSVRGTDWF